MKLVQSPLPWAPKTCLVTGKTEGTFIDFEADWVANCDPRIYISAGIIRRAAIECLGMVPQEEVEILHQRLARYEEKLNQYGEIAESLATLDRLLDGEIPQVGLTEGEDDASS